MTFPSSGQRSSIHHESWSSRLIHVHRAQRKAEGDSVRTGRIEYRIIGKRTRSEQQLAQEQGYVLPWTRDMSHEA